MMSRHCYVEKRFSAESEAMIQDANEIIADYQAQGFMLTLRQLYYQFVARDFLPNTAKNYKRLGNLIGNARLAGRIDWSAIEDRTRRLQTLSHWANAQDVLNEDAECFRIDKWARQAIRPEVWIEKEALAGVFQRICQDLDVGFFCCRGFASLSSIWAAGQRHIRNALDHDQAPWILHFGDHDPSGLAMTTDNETRLSLFMQTSHLQLRRLALNMDQVEEYDPPPNPAKMSDSRYQKYAAEFGNESWELDALEPSVLARLVEDAVMAVRDEALWKEAEEEEADHRRMLQAAADCWEEVVEMLQND